MTTWGYFRKPIGELDTSIFPALLEAGVKEEHILIDIQRASNPKARPELEKLLDNLQSGDTVILHNLTCFVKSSRDLFRLLEAVKDKGAYIKSLSDTWLDTTQTSPQSEFFLTIISAVSQLETDLAKHNHRTGIEFAKREGKYKGREKKYTKDHPGMKKALELVKAGDKTMKEICEITRVSRSALYRELRKQEEKLQ